MNIYPLKENIKNDSQTVKLEFHKGKGIKKGSMDILYSGLF